MSGASPALARVRMVFTKSWSEVYSTLMPVSSVKAASAAFKPSAS